MMLTKTSLKRKFVNLGLLVLGTCLFSLPAQGAELTTPLATTSTSWLSRWASWGAETVKNTAVKMAAFAAPLVVAKSAGLASDAVFPTNSSHKKQTFRNGCARLTLNALLIGGICKFLQKGLPYMTGDAERPFAYYAMLFPMLYAGSKVASNGKAYWDAAWSTTISSPKKSLFSWSNLGKMAGATGILLSSFWLASHMPLLVKSFFFDTPVPYFSFEHVLGFFIAGQFRTEPEDPALARLAENPNVTQNPYLGSVLKRSRTKVA